MFKSIFRKFKKSKEGFEDGKEKKNNSNVDFYKQVAEEINIKTGNPKNTIEQEMPSRRYPMNQNSINNNITDIETVSVDNNKTVKKTTKFKEHKDTYSELFSICTTMDEVIEVYIMNTGINDLYDELRLRYLNMYIFNTKLREDRLNKDELTQLIKDKGIQMELSKQSRDKENINIDNYINESKDNEEIQGEKAIGVKAKKFKEYRDTYSLLFKNSNTMDEVIEVYIMNTDSYRLYDELRLRYLSMYIFNTKLRENRPSIGSLKSTIKNRVLNKEKETIGDIIDVDIIDKELYEELRKIRSGRLELEENLDMDQLLLYIFFEYGLDAMKSGVFIKTLDKFLKDNFPIGKLNIEYDSNVMRLREYLIHRVLNVIDVQFWEPDKKRLFRCELFIVKRYIILKTIYNNAVKEFSSTKGIISLHVSPHSISNTFKVSINDDIFIANQMDKDRIVKYYEHLNRELIKEVIIDTRLIIKKIEDKVTLLNEKIDKKETSLNKKIEENITMINEGANKAEPELIILVKNFLNMMPQDIFLNKDSYIVFEHLNSYNSFIAQQLLDSTVEQRDEIIGKFKEDNYLYTDTKEFIEESYIKLIKIAGRYINIPEQHHSSVIWRLIRNYYPKFISEHWENEYQIYFENNEALSSLSEYVYAYCRCPEIPTKTVITVGKFTYYLMSKGVFPIDINGNFVQCNIQLIQEIFSKIEEIELEIFENKLTSTPVKNKDRYSINDVDLMNGYEFEKFVSYLFTKMGYMTEITKSSGDQGMDIIAEKGGNRLGIQSKCYSSKVTNKAVQEIFTALNHYNCSKGIVVTNNYFTDSAVELAQSNNIILWDRDILKSKIGELFS